MEPSVPQFLRVKTLPEGQYALVGRCWRGSSRLQLDREGLNLVNLYNYWLHRRLVALQRCAYPMWRYTGAIDRPHTVDGDRVGRGRVHNGVEEDLDSSIQNT
jgi:hypothetical protein